MEIRAAQKECYEIAESKGWHPQDETRTVGDFLLLMVTEIGEAYEEYRAGHLVGAIRIENGKPEGLPVELADAVIRIMDFFEYIGVDLEEVMRLKMDYNKTRSFRHGGKVA